MDVLVRHVWIHHTIPTLLIKGIIDSKDTNKIKAVIIYHSFAHAKENTMFIGYELAKLGFLCVCIDLQRHGERGNATEIFPYQYFFECMFHTAIEIKAVIDYLLHEERVKEKEISVFGISLGGMAALSAAVIDNRIQNIITISSSGNFAELAKCRKKPSLARILSDNQYDMDEIICQTLELSKKYDPYHNIDKIKNRNILMVNGGLDTEIPIKIVKGFQKLFDNKGNENSYKQDFIVINGLGHQVQNVMIKKACIWLEAIVTDKNNRIVADGEDKIE